MATAFEIFKPPFSREPVRMAITNRIRFRIRDAQDNALGFSYVEENADLIVAALNQFYEAHRGKPHGTG